MINALFVYGSLAPHQENAHFLNALDGHWQTAYVKGEHHPHGLPGTEGYPALTLNPNSPNIQGLIFTSAQLESIFPTLDAFEGEGYTRVLTTAYLQDGRACPTFIYAYNDQDFGL